MAGHRPWRDIRGEADRDPERRRSVAEARREAEEEQRAYEQTLADLPTHRTNGSIVIPCAAASVIWVRWEAFTDKQR